MLERERERERVEMMSAKKEQKGSMEMDNKAAEGEEQEIERVERQKQRGGK